MSMNRRTLMAGGVLAGPILAQSLRLAIMVIGGCLILRPGASIDGVFLLATAGMIAQGLVAAAAVKLTKWG